MTGYYGYLPASRKKVRKRPEALLQLSPSVQEHSQVADLALEVSDDISAWHLELSNLLPQNLSTF